MDLGSEATGRSRLPRSVDRLSLTTRPARIWRCRKWLWRCGRVRRRTLCPVKIGGHRHRPRRGLCGAVRSRLVEWITYVSRPIQKIRMDGRILARRSQLLGINGRWNIFLARPKLLIIPRFLIVRNMDRSWGHAAGPFCVVAIERDRDDVVTDGEPVAVAKPVRRTHPMVGTVQEDAVGGNVVQPVAAVMPAYLAVLAGNKAARVRQGPV